MKTAPDDDDYSPIYISVVVVANAKIKEARILLVQLMMPTSVSSSFIKSLNMLIENNVPAKSSIVTVRV